MEDCQIIVAMQTLGDQAVGQAREQSVEHSNVNYGRLIKLGDIATRGQGPLIVLLLKRGNL